MLRVRGHLMRLKLLLQRHLLLGLEELVRALLSRLVGQVSIAERQLGVATLTTGLALLLRVLLHLLNLRLRALD